MNDNDRCRYEFFMNEAILESNKASLLKEVPVGAVIVKGKEIVACGYNSRETYNSSIAHAEIIAIKKACENLNSWRLIGCEIYVTLEPCLMCVGAIMNSRIDSLIYGASDTKYGCCESIVNIAKYKYNHKLKIIKGVRGEECSNILKEFFCNLRKK